MFKLVRFEEIIYGLQILTYFYTIELRAVAVWMEGNNRWSKSSAGM